MKSPRQFIINLIVFGLCALAQVAQADSLEEAMRRFQAEQSQQIRAQGANALGAIRRSLEHRMELQRIAFVNTQTRNILRQGDRALALIRQEVCSIETMPVLAWTNEPLDEQLWPAVAAITPVYDQR